MSETRPPITAGPMARAFKFLKRTSLICGVPGEGTGVTEADNGGVVLTGDALGEAAAVGAAPGGVSSWASEIERLTNKPKIKAYRVIIRLRGQMMAISAL